MKKGKIEDRRNNRDGLFRSDFGTLGTLLKISDICLGIGKKQKEKV